MAVAPLIRPVAGPICGSVVKVRFLCHPPSQGLVGRGPTLPLASLAVESRLRPLKFRFDFRKDDFREKTWTNDLGGEREVLAHEFKRVEPLLSFGEYGGKITIVTLNGVSISKGFGSKWTR